MEEQPPGSWLGAVVEESGDHSRFRTLVENFVKDIQTGFASPEIPSVTSPSEMTLLGGKRGWIRYRCLWTKTLLLGRVFDAIFRVGHDPNDIPIVRNTAYNSLARTVLMLYRDADPDDPRPSLPRDTTDVSFQLDHRKNHWLRLHCQEGPEMFSMTIRRGKDKEQPLRVEQLAQGTDKEGIERRLRQLVDETTLAFANHFYGMATRRQATLWRWMSESFLLITTEPEGSDSSPESKEALEHHRDIRLLAARVLAMCTADIVTIFYYDPVRKELKYRASHFQPRYRYWRKFFWRLIEQKLMGAAAAETCEGKQLREKSIAYKATGDRIAYFCRAWDEDTQKCDPPGRTVLNPCHAPGIVEECRRLTRNFAKNPKAFTEEAESVKKSPEGQEEFQDQDVAEEFTRKSAIAAPLMVHGRLFGVLEVDGFSPHQFRFDTLYHVEQMANIIGPFLHHREMLRRLYNLSKVVSDPNEADDGKKYRAICKTTAEIFLAKASLLFVPQFLGSNEFECKAHFNLDDLDKEIPFVSPGLDDAPPEEGHLFRQFDRQGKLIQSIGESFFAYRYSIRQKVEEDKAGLWQDAERWPHRPVIHKMFEDTEEGGWGVVIYVYDPRTHLLLLRLSLYYDDKQSIADREWGPSVQFASHYLATLVIAMRGLKPLMELREELDGCVPLDISDGLRILRVLKDESERKLREANAALASHPESLVTESSEQRTWTVHVPALRDAYTQGKLVAVLGTGVSVPYGIPTWKDLLGKLMIKSYERQLESGGIGTQQNRTGISRLLAKLFHSITKDRGPLSTGRLIREQYSDHDDEFRTTLRAVLFPPEDQELPPNYAEERCLEQLAKLCRGENSPCPLNSVITYNYDDLLEAELRDNPPNGGVYPVYGPDYDNERSGFRVFHAHGYLEREGAIVVPSDGKDPKGQDQSPSHMPTLTEILYHKMYAKPYAWENLQQLSRFMDMTCLFVGMSFADPNLRRLMDMARQQSDSKDPRHYLIRRRIDRKELFQLAWNLSTLLFPVRKGAKLTSTEAMERCTLLAEMVRLMVAIFDNQAEQELLSFGVQTLWIGKHEEIPKVLEAVRTGSASY
ncbi:MAG: SIR2 family protein [Thermodesulfobacteriota bacterium]